MKKTFRKIHLWLSVPFGIFITLICFSGAMLVFEKEITEALRRDLYYVNEVKEQPLPLDSLMKAVTATLPDSVEVTGVTISPDRERAYQVSLSKPRRASIYVDQYTGEVKGRSGRLPFYDTMFHMHRWMMGSSQGFGKLLVGVSTLMLVIILITGILMWLSNRKKPLTKSLTISFTKGWPRFWHDLHVAGGIYTTVFLLALALTGLTWSFSWYRTGFYAMFGVEASAGGHGGGHGSAESRGEREGRGGAEGRRHHGDGSHTRRDSTAGDNSKAYHGRHKHHADSGTHGAGNEARNADNETNSAGTAAATASKTDTPVADTDADNGEERTSRHGGHGRRGGRGAAYHHNQDSTAAYAGHHPEDSLHSRRHRRHDIADAEQIQANAAVTNATDDKPVQTEGTRAIRGRNKASRNKESYGRSRESADSKPRQAIYKEVTDTAASDTIIQTSPYAHWQDVFDNFAKAHPGFRQITISDGSASVVPAGRNSLRAGDRFDFDSTTGKVIGSKPYSAQEKGTKVRSGVYMVHTGSWGGMLTRIITFIAALLGATLPLTGYYLWIMKRRRKGKAKKDNR